MPETRDVLLRAVFLDRDGTVILDPPDDRVDSISDIHVFPQTLQALQLLSTLGYAVFEITNQAGISEGRISKSEAERINRKILEVLESSGVKILKTYMCPHASEDNCVCRKPKPTMIFRAAEEFGIDLSKSYMIGDQRTDVQAGNAAGTKTILVQTANVVQTSEAATFTAPSILEAIQYIAEQESATI